MDEVNVKCDYKCFICNVGNMTHEEWKEHHSADPVHRRKVLAAQHKRFYCEKCNVQCTKNCEYIRHCSSKKHTGKGTISAKELYCVKCETQCRNKSEWAAHLETRKHTKENSANFTCQECDYTCKKEHLWAQHLKTTKHLRNTNTNGEGISRPVLKTIDQGTQSD